MIQMPLAEFEEMKQHFQRDKQELQNERKLLEQELAEKDEEIAALKAKLQELNWVTKFNTCNKISFEQT